MDALKEFNESFEQLIATLNRVSEQRAQANAEIQAALDGLKDALDERAEVLRQIREGL